MWESVGVQQCAGVGSFGTFRCQRCSAKSRKCAKVICAEIIEFFVKDWRKMCL
ncbi:hypothetical protein DMR_30170 [Solidesulfovibrio magneticus RS-1]|uniref:Uncharacterized protein n=1 Tax=Solidesulfovibrio magneticus (strain ATCC 700980 / DSM 13731 / RS-1) TaxID=573370 RepID=C4XID3_SOLM1|nr:hypothetical protein DMR_30170 [Solidesulfovibrio magneticus RS-1]